MLPGLAFARAHADFERRRPRGRAIAASACTACAMFQALPYLGAMPLSVSSLIAVSFFDSCASPMPRNTCGALVN